LKRKEKISGRLGDVLSVMYLVSATLKHYEDQRIKEDLPLVRWSVRDALYDAQQAIDQILSNFPQKWMATMLRWTIYPLGTPWRPPTEAGLYRRRRRHAFPQAAPPAGPVRRRRSGDAGRPHAAGQAGVGSPSARRGDARRRRAAGRRSEHRPRRGAAHGLRPE